MYAHIVVAMQRNFSISVNNNEINLAGKKTKFTDQHQ